ncbi:MAG: hypothetical protein ABEH88_05555 [Halobacteriales archaeon]
MRERIADLNRRIEQRQKEVTLSRPVSYRDVARFFLWRGGYALAGPVVILLGQPLVTGFAGTILMLGGLLALVLGGFVGSARALGRLSHAAGFGVLALCALFFPVLWVRTADAGISPAFATGIGAVLGLTTLVVALAALDAVRREVGP